MIDPHPIAEQRQYLLNVLVPGNSVRVALLEGRMVGFIAATQHSIAQLHVSKGFHRRGIGAQLLAWAKEQSGGSLWLYTFERNAVACAFYEKNGFHLGARGFEPQWQLRDLQCAWSRNDVDAVIRDP